MLNDEDKRLRSKLMATQEERLRQEIRMENRKFVVQFVLAIVAAVGVGIALGRFVIFHT